MGIISDSAVSWKSSLDQRKGRRNEITKNLHEKHLLIYQLKKEEENIEKARELIIEVAKQTQTQLEYHVGEVVSLALNALDMHYEFELEFTEKRGKTEAQLWLKDIRTDEKLTPIDSTGGGVVDVCSFALRAALWSLQRPRSRNVLILDEPFRFVSQSLQRSTTLLLKEVSKQLEIQIIMVSHNEALIEAADRVFRFKLKEGKTLISEEENKNENFPSHAPSRQIHQIHG